MKKRKDGRYQKNIYIGRDENGKRKYKSVCGTSRKEVETLAAELKQKLGKGIDISSDDTYGCWKKRWLTVQRSLQTPQQYKTLERYLKHFAELEPYKINKLTIADFQEIVFDLAAKNPTTGKPTAKKSLKEFIATASRVFEYAIENRAIDFNPLKYVKISKNAAKKKERRALSPEEQKLIINTPHRGRLPAMIMLLAGLRRGECLGLQWADIDLKRNKINVHQTLVLNGNNSYIKAGAKTEAGVRKVDIPTVLSDYLKSLAPHSPFDYVVTTTKGKLMTNSAWRRLWESYINCLNLEAFNSQQGKIVGIAPRSKYCPDGIPQIIEPFTAHCLRHPYVKHTTKIFSLRLMDFQAQAYPDARRKTRGACQLHQGGQSRSPVRLLCNRKQLSCLPPQSKMSWILYAISMRLSGYTSTRSISSSASSVVSVSASKIALDASLRLSCRACSSCFCFACANTAA